MLAAPRRAHAGAMRSVLVLALASCIPYEPTSTYIPVTADSMTCHLGTAYEGKLSFPGLTDITTLECTAENRGGWAREICAQPYVGVRETGAIYTAHGEVCSTELQPNEKATFAVKLDMRRELCRLDRGGCVIRVVGLTRDETPEAGEAIAFAHALEAHATAPGRDRPSLAECDAMLGSWLGKPAFLKYTPLLAHHDDMRLLCLGLTRAQLACMSEAHSSAEVDRCAA